METIFPTGTGYEGFFMVGSRKDPTSLTTTQRTGTAVLKRTYDIDPAPGGLTPVAEALPVFLQDVAENFLLNSDFESDLLDGKGHPIDWLPEGGASIAKVLDRDDADNHFMGVSGTANSRVVQTITLEEPLGGRSFAFSFSTIAESSSSPTSAISPFEPAVSATLVRARWPTVSRKRRWQRRSKARIG